MINKTLIEFIPSRIDLDIMEVPYFWNINSFYEESGKIYMQGWFLPIDGKINVTGLVVGDFLICPSEIEVVTNHEVQKRYPWWPNAVYSDFKCAIPRKYFRSMGDTKIIPYSTVHENIIEERHAIYISIDDFQKKSPPKDMLERIGSASVFHHHISGLTLARQFHRAYNEYTNLSWDELNSICDWGCGSGRIANHVLDYFNEKEHLIKFLGYDVDGPAIDYCNKNFGSCFVNTDINPPLPISSNYLDLVYSYSVFTHLRRDDMMAWIDELHRVLKPGGILMFTVLGGTAMLANLPYAEKNILDKFNSGIYDEVGNDQLNSIGISGDYYKNTWLSNKKIESIVAGRFDLLAIESNFHFYQDLVICRKR